MIDPFTLITAYTTSQKINRLLSGNNVQHLLNGIEHFSNGIEKHDSNFLEKAITEFDLVNENEDRLFVLAFSYLYRAYCYTYLLKFSLAYHYLDKIESINYNFFTRKKDTIDEIKRDGKAFRNEVKKLENAYNEYLKSNNEDNDYRIHEAQNLWKKAFIILSCVMIVGVVAVIIFALF